MRVCCFEVLGLRFRLPNGRQEPMPQSHLSAIIVTIIIAIVMITLIIVAFSMRRTCPHTPPHAIGCCNLRSINAATAGNLRAVKITTFSTLTSASASPIQRRKYRKLRHRVHDMYEAGGGSSDAHAASGVWRVNFVVLDGGSGGGVGVAGKRAHFKTRAKTAKARSRGRVLAPEKMALTHAIAAKKTLWDMGRVRGGCLSVGVCSERSRLWIKLEPMIVAGC